FPIGPRGPRTWRAALSLSRKKPRMRAFLFIIASAWRARGRDFATGQCGASIIRACSGAMLGASARWAAGSSHPGWTGRQERLPPHRVGGRGGVGQTFLSAGQPPPGPAHPSEAIMRFFPKLPRRPLLRQGVFDFLERRSRHERWFKRLILAATCLTI